MAWPAKLLLAFDLAPASPPFHSQSTCHGLGPKDLLEGQREILFSVERRFSLSSQDYQRLCLSQRRPQAEYPALTDSWHLPRVPTTASHIPLSHRGAGWWREAWPQHSLYVFSCSNFHSYKVEIYIYSLHLIKKWDFSQQLLGHLLLTEESVYSGVMTGSLSCYLEAENLQLWESGMRTGPVSTDNL